MVVGGGPGKQRIGIVNFLGSPSRRHTAMTKGKRVGHQWKATIFFFSAIPICVFNLDVCSRKRTKKSGVQRNEIGERRYVMRREIPLGRKGKKKGSQFPKISSLRAVFSPKYYSVGCVYHAQVSASCSHPRVSAEVHPLKHARVQTKTRLKRKVTHTVIGPNLKHLVISSCMIWSSKVTIRSYHKRIPQRKGANEEYL